jgi:hypothetical protein
MFDMFRDKAGDLPFKTMPSERTGFSSLDHPITRSSDQHNQQKRLMKLLN